VLDLHIEGFRGTRIRSLEAPETAMRCGFVVRPAALHRRLQLLQTIFDASDETIMDRFLLFATFGPATLLRLLQFAQVGDEALSRALDGAVR
jgi:hypothetical protein